MIIIIVIHIKMDIILFIFILENLLKKAINLKIFISIIVLILIENVMKDMNHNCKEGINYETEILYISFCL